MPKIELDITCANEATLYFENIISLSLIGTVQVFISVGTTNFYIIDIHTPFFLYLKDINTLSIYLNNITNQFIC